MRGGSDLTSESYREKQPRTSGLESNRSLDTFVIWRDPAEAHSETNAIESKKWMIGDGKPLNAEEKQKNPKYASQSPDLENKTVKRGMDKVTGTTTAATGKLLTGGRKPFFDSTDLEKNHGNQGLIKADPSDLKQIFI